MYMYNMYMYMYTCTSRWMGGRAGSLEKVGRSVFSCSQLLYISSERSCINLGAVAGVKGVVHVLPPIPLHSSSYTWVLLLGRTRRPVKDKEAKIL